MAVLHPTSPGGEKPVLRAVGMALPLVLISCDGSGGGGAVLLEPAGEFLVLRTEPPNNGSVYLNDSIDIDFSHRVDLASASFDAIRFTVWDSSGDALSEPVSGSFHLQRSPGDPVVGRRLQFRPTLPRNDTFSDGGVKAGRSYRVELTAGNQTGPGLRNVSQRGLDRLHLPYRHWFAGVTAVP